MSKKAIRSNKKTDEEYLAELTGFLGTISTGLEKTIDICDGMQSTTTKVNDTLNKSKE